MSGRARRTRRRRLAAGLLALTAPALAIATGCADRRPVPEGRTPVVVGGETFFMEIAADGESRVEGLSFREEIEPDGGMVFVFPDQAYRAFVMRHCLVPIDIAYVSNSGRIVRWHEMEVEPPKREDESDRGYEMRLKRYGSGAPVRYVLEFAGGTLRRLGVEEGDVVEMDFAGLKAMAR